MTDTAPRIVRSQSGDRPTHRAPDLLSILTSGIPAWMERATCRDADPDIFFPVKGKNPDDARAICAGCPVQDDCFEFAMADQGMRHEVAGVWGGTTGAERRRLKARR